MKENMGILPDPEEGFDGNYVFTPFPYKSFVCKYDIRAFAKFKQETGIEWNDLTEEEKESFILPKYRKKKPSKD